MTLESSSQVGAPSMLLRFRGSNIRSFRNEFEISLVATAMSEGAVVRQISWRNGTTASSNIGVLPAAAFYGANGSGKSNVLRAMADMRSAVLNSFRGWPTTGGTRRKPFRLGALQGERPSVFEVEIVLEGVLHSYGFELNDELILREWATRSPNGRSQLMFERNGDDIQVGSTMRPSLSTASEIVRPNSLLLSTAVALRDSELLPLYEWFRRNLLLAEAESRDARQLFTVRLLHDNHREAQILALLRAADLGIVGVEEIKMEPALREKLEQVAAIFADGQESTADPDNTFSFVDGVIGLVHHGEHGNVRFDVSDESLGTLVWLGLVGPIVDALENGSVLLADELDASLHPRLVRQIVDLFQSPATNPRRAQILFNSHDVSLLGDSAWDRVLGRDQVWFTDKDADGSSHLAALSDMNPRRAEAVGKRYLAGRYGGVPLISSGEFEDAIYAAPMSVDA